MLREIEYPKSGEYRTGTEHEPICFFLNTLPVSNQFNILLGYFSSSAIHLLSLGFAGFIFNGGKVRMVINHILSVKDKKAVLEGNENPESAFDFTIRDFKKIKQALDEYGTHFFNCLAWLIASKRIEIRVVKPNSNKGISHYKSGIFSDGRDKVKFKSSCNFTAFGLLENLEELDIKQSWDSKSNMAAIEEYESYFDSIFENKVNFVEHLPFEEIEEAIKDNFGNKDIQELLVEESRLIEKKRAVSQNNIIKKILEGLEKYTRKLINQPRFPFPEPRDYQVEAYESWVVNEYKGIFAMATGTGKTITSLNCVLESWKRSEPQVYRAIILVPTLTLVEQWEKEALAFNFREIITVSSKTSWAKELSDKLTYAKRLPDVNFIVIVTYSSFPKEKFQSFFRRFPKDTILIADEGHNFASTRMLNTYPDIHLEKRLCLSATPKRIYDPIGTAEMEQFFNDTEPYTYSFGMERAIDEGILCKYYYYPHLVRLTLEELEDYKEISKELIRHFDFKKGEYRMSPKVEILLLQRKRIIQKAENKLHITIGILRKQFEKNGNLKYTFLYAPEGFKQQGDELIESEEGLRIINQYTREIADIDSGILIDQFVGGMPDKDSVLQHFEKGKIHVLASMKCLDEGVDVPRAEFAIFCSSTGNPRQFIQRRGRVLRKHNDKHIATIHDLVVIPDFMDASVDEENFNMEKNLVRKELERVMYFASLAINPYETDKVFADVCYYYNLNIYTIKNELKSV